MNEASARSPAYLIDNTEPMHPGGHFRQLFHNEGFTLSVCRFQRR
jgi:hypothetical protein